jgi:hypothetical protein
MLKVPVDWQQEHHCLQAKVYELQHFGVVSTLRTSGQLGLGGAAFLKSGAQRRVMTGSMDCTVATWDAATGALQATLDLREDGTQVEGGLGCVNPPMAHALTVPASDDGHLNGRQMCALPFATPSLPDIFATPDFQHTGALIRVILVGQTQLVATSSSVTCSVSP